MDLTHSSASWRPLDPSLSYLLALRLRSGLRRMGRRFEGVRGKLLLLAVASLVGLVLGSQLILLLLTPAQYARGLTAFRADVLLYAPPALLVIALLGTRAHGFYFKPAEIQFLFPAPIARRQLVFFNILSRMQISLLSAAWVWFFAVRHAATWYGAFLAIFLLLTFNQLTGQLAGLWLSNLRSGRRGAGRAGWRVRPSGAVFVAAAVVLAAVALPASGAPWPFDFADAASRILASPGVVVLSSVTRPFVEIFLAESISSVAGWTATAGGILAAQVTLLLWLDANRLDALVVAEGGAPPRRGGGPALGRSRRRGAVARLPLPIGLLPQLRGAGPLAWRQMQELLRSPETFFRGALGLIAVLPVLVVRSVTSDGEGASVGIAVLISALLVIPMLIDGVDFRRDLDRMAVLRALPISPFAITLGQLVPTTILLTFWMSFGVVVISQLVSDLPQALLVVVFYMIPPFAMLTAAIDNLLFLLMPYRPRTRDPGETTFLGRLTMIMSVKMIALLASMGLSVVCVGLVLRLVTPSPWLAGMVAFVVLCVCSVPLIAAVARAFERFDVAQEVPE